MRTFRRRLLAVPVGLALLLASCNGTAPSSPGEGRAALMPPDSASDFEVTSRPLVRSLSFSPDLCGDGQDVYVVAHQDDDLLFMNSDIHTSIRQNHCAVTVFLTAGDNEHGTQQQGLDYQQYWRNRESGMRAAYAQMAGVTNAWTDQIYAFAGKAIRTSVLQGNPRVRLMFLRLRESSSSGVTMRALWEGPGTLSAPALDGSNTFTRQDVINVLTNVMTVSEAKYVHIQDTAPHPYGGVRNEHPDHVAAARFAEAADRAYTAPHVTVQYRDYNIGAGEANLTQAQFADKLAAFKTYATFDPIICPPQGGATCVAPGASGNFYVEWSRRQYFHIDPTLGGSVARLADGRLAAFVIGDHTSSLRKLSQTAAGGSSWGGWDDLKGNFASTPTVVGMADGRLAAFVRGNDGAVYVKTEQVSGGAWGDWGSLGGVVSSTPTVAAQADGRLVLFVRGNDGQLYLKSQLTPNGSWGGWTGIGGPKFTSNPAAALDRFGCLVVFVRGQDGTVATVAQTAANLGWGTWTSLGGSFGSDVHPVVGRDQDGRLEVFVRGQDGRLYHRWQTFSDAWGGWGRLSDLPFTGSPVVETGRDGTIEVFVRSVGGSVQSVRQTGPNAGWGAMTDLGGSFVTLIGTRPNASGLLTTVARGTDDLLYQRTQGDSTWKSLLAP